MYHNLEELFDSVQVNGIVLQSALKERLQVEYGIDFESDARLAPARKLLSGSKDELTKEEFVQSLSPCAILLLRVCNNNLAVTDWGVLVDTLEKIYQDLLENKEGDVAHYIPQLAQVNPDKFAISVCTVDGQRFHIGDSEENFSIQSVSFPMLYMLALEENGALIHEKIGFEPSGHNFNAFTFLPDGKPHNTYVNSGALLNLSFIRPKLETAERFKYITTTLQDLAGGEPVGYSEAVYESEKATGNRNKALSLAMLQTAAYPEWMDDKEKVEKNLDLYFQTCSVEVNTRSLSVMAGSIANQGICPTTTKNVFEASHVGASVALMYTCGLYNYSGEFAFLVGLPAKSGVSGGLLLVVPGVMGIAIWSPRIDQFGNSVRGVEVAKLLTARLTMHGYDRLPHAVSTLAKEDRISCTKKPVVDEKIHITCLLDAAALGDIPLMRRMLIAGVSVNAQDEQGHTALMVAAARGRLQAVKYLLTLGSDRTLLSRRGLKALDFAKAHSNIRAVLE